MTEPSVGPLTRGFLFADLRDYTAYADAHGDRAAADLLDRYRALVRATIARSAGAEIRTEGDSFYVVFPSASAAVGAGLAIVAAAAEASAAEPNRPIRVGIGIHAGETEERAEGYVGTAVNVAARVCAEAAAGEVLVTETVRSLTRTGGRYRFVSRGSHRLKGLAEPVALYRADLAGEGVVDGTPADGSERWARPTRLAAAAIATVIVGIAAFALLDPLSGSSAGGSPSPPGPIASVASGSASPSPPASEKPLPLGGPLTAGTYVSTAFTPSVRLTFPNDDWCLEREIANEIRMTHCDQQARLELGVFRPVIGYNGCAADETTLLGPKIQDVVDYLRGNTALEVDQPEPVPLGRLDTVMVRFRLGAGCGPNRGAVPLFRMMATSTTVDDPWAAGEVAFRGYVYEVYLTQVGDQVLGVWIGAPEDQWADLQASARSLLSSLEVVR